jgi:glycosyltransferase involved in cell wall biosynthesis
VARDIETPQEFADAIRGIAELPREEYEAMCRRVREVAERFDYKVLAEREIELLG